MTAVEWLGNEITNRITRRNPHDTIIIQTQGEILIELIEQAKEMEKEQIKDAWLNSLTKGDFNSADEYYDETLNQNKMKIVHLINDTYQVVSEDEQTIYFQGSRDDCEKYRMNKLFNL